MVAKMGTRKFATTDCEEELNNEMDIYNDLPDFRYDETIDKLNATIAKLEAENNELHSMLTEMKKEKDILETKCSALETNITSLLKTAKLEIQRKERTIKDLRQQLSEATSSKTFRLKRQFEHGNQNKNNDIKYSRRDSETREPVSKKPKFSESDKIAKDIVLQSEETINGNISTYKPPPKITQASQKENVPLTMVQEDTPPGKINAISKVPAPKLPAFNCPTLFSARMYQRLNNQSATRTITLPSVPLISIRDDEPQNRVPAEERNFTEEQKCAIPSEKTVSKPLDDDDVKLPSSNFFHQKSTALSVSSVVDNPKSTPAKNDSALKRTELNLRLVSDVKKIVCESDTNGDSAQSPSNKCKIGNKVQDRVKNVFPPAKVSTALSSDRTTKFQYLNAKNRKFTRVSLKSSNHLDARSTLLKIPPNGNGKSDMNVFIPISSAWNCSKPPSSTPLDEASKNKCQQRESVAEGGKGLEVNRITSELTVNVDNELLGESVKQAVDLFGSPAKWADDCSSDSANVNRNKFDYTLFGSPYKNGDSCSSEPVNFVLPPGAYEDSCCTNQPLDKASLHPIKTPPVQSLPDLTSNLVPTKNKGSASVSESNDRDDRKNDDSFPPPVLRSGKNNKSVFSPPKDSKTATSLPIVALDSRSSTGICFPFKLATRYEDSVLGQFDDTAQFVSALAKVDTQISPLSTPMKNSDVDESQVSQCKTIDTPSVNNPTSFKEVFQNKNLQDVSMVASIDASVRNENYSSKKTCQVKNSEPPVSISLGSIDTKASQQKAENVCCIVEKVEESNTTFKEVDSSTSLSSSKFIHRSNFSSSFVFTVSSDSQSFHDKPVNVLQPRKTPRAVVNKRSPVAPTGSCNDVNLKPRIAIPDAFITEQEERVRQWQKNHLYENTLKTPSPTKCQVKINGSNCETKRASSPMKTPKKHSPGANRLKPPLSCTTLETASSESKTQKNTGVINRLQPKRVPRHPVSSRKNSDRVMKPVAAISKPEGVTIVDTPPCVLDNNPPCTVAVDTTTKALNVTRSVVETVVPMPVTAPVSAKSSKGDTSIDVPNTPHLTPPRGPLQSETASEKTEAIPTVGTNNFYMDNPPPPSTHKALNMIYSVMDKIVSEVTTFNNVGGTIEVPSPVVPVHLKPEPVINNEKLPENSNTSPINNLVEVICVSSSSKYVKSISQVKPSSTQNSIPKLRVSRISGLSKSISTPIIKKTVVKRDSDFKRSSALKNFGDNARNHNTISIRKSPTTAEGVLEENHTSKDLPSRRTLIRRKSAPILNISSLSTEKRFINKSLTRTSSSSSLKNVQDPNRHIADEQVVKWIVHPIEVDLPENIYGCISSSFSSNDPRALPKLVEPRPPVSSQYENLGKDNQNMKFMLTPHHQIISRVGEQSIPEIKLTRPIVTSTPIPLKTKALVPDTAENKVKRLSTARGTFLPNTPMKHPVFQKNGRVVTRSTVLLDSSIKQERKVRGRKPQLASLERNCRESKILPRNKKYPKGPSKAVLAELPQVADMVTTSTTSPAPISVVLNPEIASPEGNCREPKIIPRNRKYPKGASKAISAELPPVADIITTPTTSPALKSVVLNHPHLVSSTTSLSQSVASTSTPQSLRIIRKRKIPNLSSVTVVNSDKPVIVSRRRPPSFGVSNSST